MNIEIVTTAKNSPLETDFDCHSSCLDVLESIKRNGYTARLTVCNSLDDLENVVLRKPDFVLLGSKYMSVQNAEDIWLSEFFSNNQVTFSGSCREALQFDSDNISAKVHLANMRIRTARHFTALPEQFLTINSLPLAFPLFIKSSNSVKPVDVDNMSLVNTITEFKAKVLSVCTTDKQPALIEEYLVGRDFVTAILCNSCGEITASSIEVIKQEDKLKNKENLANIESMTDLHNINEFAKSAFLGLGLRGFGLIRIKMDKHGQCYFMKTDLVSDLAFDRYYFLKACEIANNLTYDQIINFMLEECSGRARSDRIHYKVLKQRNQHWPRASVTRGF